MRRKTDSEHQQLHMSSVSHKRSCDELCVSYSVDTKDFILFIFNYESSKVLSYFFSISTLKEGDIVFEDSYAGKFHEAAGSVVDMP